MKYFNRFFLLLIVAFCMTFFVAVNSYAKGSTSTRSLHERTKIYSQNNDDYFDGCESFSYYKSKTPAITVLTHGYGGNASHWSNSVTNTFDYNSASLVTKICEKNKNGIDIYVAKCKTSIEDGKIISTDFDLFKYEQIMIDNEFHYKELNVERINDATKHILLLFQSGEPTASNTHVYDEFENVIDSISLQYKSLTGVLPRLNLVGHSRGGLTNIMYATEHPYNVAEIYSLGTPYNGSKLGNCDFVLDVVCGKQPNGEYTPGVKSIMSQDEIKRIRDNWNGAYRSDVTCHVTALGSATSLNYINEFIEDTANGVSSYSDQFEAFSSKWGTALKIVKALPLTTGLSLKFYQGLAHVVNFFNSDINLYDSIVVEIKKQVLENPYDENGEIKNTDLTIEEADGIIELYKIINGKAVIMDDLFIDLNSQLGYFDGEDDFKGFNRYIKIFEPEDITENRAMPTEPAVVHNMEIYNETYTNYISKNLVYGSSETNATLLEEQGSFSGNVDGEKVLQFYSSASGFRKITTNCEYTICKKDGTDLKIIENEVFLEEGKSYFIVLKTDKSTEVNLEIEVAQEYGTVTDFSEHHKQIFYITNLPQGFYKLNSTDVNAKYYDIEGNEIKYVYSAGEQEKYYIVVESKTSNSSFSTKDPDTIKVDVNNYNYVKNDLVCLNNKYKTALKYVITVAGTDDNMITIFDSNNNEITTSVTFDSDNNIAIYTVTVSSKGSVFIRFNKDTTVSVKLADEQLFWCVGDNIISDGKYEVRIGCNYSISLKLLSKEYFDGVENNYEFSDGSAGISWKNNYVVVSSTALVGKSVTMSHNKYAARLVLEIIPKKDLTMSISNSNDIKIGFVFSNSGDQIDHIYYSIITNGETILNSEIYYVQEKYITLDKESLKSYGEYFTIVITGIRYEYGSMFDSSYYNKYEETFNSFYYGGNGTQSSPYEINCQRHLENIKHNPASYFKLINDITVDGWTPLFFNGILEGNTHNVYGLSLENNNSEYGLFSTNRGIIKNLIIRDAFITSTEAESSACGGFIAGYNVGIIQNCTVSNCKIVANTTAKIGDYASGSMYGGIVGTNHGTIKNCTVQNLTMEAAGLAGGVAGYNSKTIESCNVVSANITYNYVKPASGNYWDYNGRVGGVAGYNSGKVTKCTSSGNMYWINETDNNRDIYPSLGTIVGMNDTYAIVEDCSSSMGTKYKYFYWKFIGWYDQSGRCFKVNNGLIGYQKTIGGTQPTC